MMAKLRTPQGIFFLLTIAAFIYFLYSVVAGRMDELFFGLGIEIIGAIMTAVGVLALERLYAEPDENIAKLQAQVEAQNKKLDELQTTLQAVLSKSEKPDS